MVNLPYSGSLLRRAHFSSRPPVPGVIADHGPEPDTTVDPDPFDPRPQTPAGQGHDVWQPTDDTGHTSVAARPFSHWTNLVPPLPMNVKPEYVHVADTERLIANHSVVDFTPDTSRKYHNATEGRSIEFIDGRMPQLTGIEGPEFLVAGKNSFDFTNQPNEVYQGDSANVGRYRLGKRIDDFGHYEFWTKQGQDANLRAYTGLQPDFPVAKERVPDSAPYTPNSSGTTTWLMDHNQKITMFTAPSETSMSDYEAASGDVINASSEFNEGDRL